jgi:hypothetical protein
MPSFFVPGKGCVYSPSGASGGGWYKLDGLAAGGAGGAGGGPVLILGAQLTDADLVNPVTALGNIKILYVFGQKFGEVQILGSVLCGPSGSNGGAFGQVTSFFEAHRVSNSESPVNLSIPGGKSYKIYVTGLGLAQPDAELHIQPFMIYGLIANPSGGE